MNRNTLILIVLVISSVVKAQDWDQPLLTGGSDAPNILFFCTDQQKWNTIGALGNKYVHTPNLDRLVKEGVSFTNTYVQSTVCTPSRSSFMTGMYPSTLHSCKNGQAIWPEGAPLISKMLRDAGYDCGLSGKLHLSTAHVHLPEQRPEDDGFRVFKYSHEPGQRHSSNNYLMWLREKGFDYEELKDKNGYIPTNLHQTKWCTDMAIDYIKEQREYPWFFMINVFDPHGPFDPPQEFINRYDIDILPNPIVSENDYNTNSEIVEQIMFQSRPEKYSERENKKRLVKYFAQIDLIDVQIGRLLKVLKESGQLDNTLIVFMSDHGDMTGDHGLTSKGCRFYESLVKVPLIFWYPAKIKANIQSDALVELTDIVPTLLEITEVEGHERIQGMSLLPILTGRKPADHHRDYVRCEFYDALAVDEDEGIEPSFGTMYRNKKYKLNVYHGIEQGELYDMEKDPNEFNNLWYDKKYKDIKYKLIKKSFDVTVRNIDTGPRRLGRF